VKFPDRILLGHGGGGRLTRALVTEGFLPALENPFLALLSDAAVLPPLPPGRPALTTDAFVVDPVLFPGGDLGTLSVCGTVNDLAMAGARPLWLTWAVILEEGLEGKVLEAITRGAARAAAEAGVAVVAGDTKVVPRGKGDGAFAVTAGLGVVPPGRELGDHRVEPGDRLLVSGPVGDHGAAVLAARHGMTGSGLISDCAPLSDLVEVLLNSGAAVRTLHDPTRGGVATTCHEVAQRAGLRMVLEGACVPVSRETAAVAELLGVDPLYLACEGRLVAWVAAGNADAALAVLRSHPRGREAACIGRVEESPAGAPAVVLRTPYGVDRLLDPVSASDLPRIC